MHLKSRNIFLFILVIAGWFALIGQFYLIIENRVASLAETVARYFGFFTILTNILVAVCCTFLLFKPGSVAARFFSKATTQTAIAVYITVVGLIYNIILRFLWKPEGLQMIVSRQSDLTKAPAIITVARIEGGIRNNIIPQTCTMRGTIRTLDAGMQKDIYEKLKRTATNISEASGATAEVTIETKTLVTYNDPELTKKTVSSLQSAAGEVNVKEREWVTGSEDFSYFGTKAPAFFFYLGGMPKGNNPQKAPAHHTSDFFIDESGMKTGIKAFCNIVFDYLNRQ